MTSELLTFTNDRLLRLKEAYASAVALDEKEFNFDGYNLTVAYAFHLINDLEKHFVRANKTKPIYLFSRNSK